MDLILLNGPSSAGKSTIAKRLLARLGTTRECSLIALDDYMTVGTNEEIWEDDVFAATERMYADVSQALAENRLVIVDHVITSRRIYDALLAAVGPRAFVKALVTCSLETLRARERKRGDRYIGSAEASLRFLYPTDGYDVRVDTEKQSAEEILDAIIGAMGP